MDEDQLDLLRDKYVLWDRAAREGPLDLRDYNRRCADAMKTVLSERHDLYQRGMDDQRSRDWASSNGHDMGQ